MRIDLTPAAQPPDTLSYFDTDAARAGLYRLEFRHGVAWLLLPDQHRAALAEMRTGQRCIITYGRLEGAPAYELLFVDGSAAPFSIHLPAHQCGALWSATRVPRALVVLTRAGAEAWWPAQPRLWRDLPCLRQVFGTPV